MKHLKTFESYGKLNSDIHQDIANDLLPRFQKIKDEQGKFTMQDYIKYMETRGADPMMVDCVASCIVNIGFDFDFEKDDDDDVEFVLKNTIY